MKEDQVKSTLTRMLFPTYEEKFGFRPAWNEFNVSSLVAGTTEFLYWYRNSRDLPGNLTPRFNRNLLRGTAIDSLAKSRLADGWADGDGKDSMMRHRIPYEWKALKKGERDYWVIGHFDMAHVGEAVVVEMKAPDVMRRFVGDGWLSKAKMQVGAYAKYLELKHGKPFQAFIAAIESDIHLVELTREEVEFGWQYVLFIAKSAAEALDR